VLQEYYVVVTSKLDPGLSADQARQEVRLLQAWQPVAVDLDLLEKAWSVQDRHRLSFWDALIVAAALQCGARHLLTEDLQDGQLFEELRVVNPFRHDPSIV